MFKSVGLLLLLCAICVFCVEIDRVDDTDLVYLLTGEKNVIVLFTKNSCSECEEYETVVSNLQNEFKTSLDASIAVVKAIDSNLVGIYDPTREPALVYFRRGIPLLYYGAIQESDIMEFFSDNREPIVKELSDEHFEHLTQASTGATTGDWFIFFYSAECVFCQRLYAVWESVGSKLKRKLNVARINRLEAGTSTAKRLGVLESPEFIFLRQGKIYRYTTKEYTPKAFIEFAESGYTKQTHPAKVPAPPSLMDDFFGQLQEYVKTLQVFQLAVISLILIFAIVIILKCLSRKPQPNAPTKKNK